MNKGQQFWHELWSSGQISFHQQEINPDLKTFWPQLNSPVPSHVFVPLCGKSLDMLWLLDQGNQVTGIELSELAVEQFMAENNLSLTREIHEQHLCYRRENLCIWVADIFTFNTALIAPVTLIYDRASLIALPELLRKPYVQFCLDVLKSDGQILLKTLDGGNKHVQGPPYRVTAGEVAQLYQSCERHLLTANKSSRGENEVFRSAGINEVLDTVWVITKRFRK